MASLLGKLHIFIILFAAFTGYQTWVEESEKLESAKSSIASIENRIRSKRKELKEIRKYKKNIEETKKNIEIVALEVEKIQKQLPNEINDTEILDSLKTYADSLNIKNVYLAPSFEEDRGFYVAKEFEFKASGTYLQFLIFLEKISKSERILNIKELVFEKKNKKQRGRYQVINCTAKIEAYRYNSSHKEDRGFQDIEKKFDSKNKKKKRKRRKKKA